MIELHVTYLNGAHRVFAAYTWRYSDNPDRLVIYPTADVGVPRYEIPLANIQTLYLAHP